MILIKKLGNSPKDLVHRYPLLRLQSSLICFDIQQTIMPNSNIVYNYIKLFIFTSISPPMSIKQIQNQVTLLKNTARANQCMKFFKTGPG